MPGPIYVPVQPFNRGCATALCVLVGLGARTDHRGHIRQSPRIVRLVQMSVLIRTGHAEREEIQMG